MAIIRKFKKGDEAEIKKISGDSAFMGEPVEIFFQDRALFTDAWTDFYLKYEPESIFVAEDRGKVIGYLVGCKDSRKELKKLRLMAPRFIAKMILRTVSGVYTAKTRKMAKYYLLQSGNEISKVPREFAHFHINLDKKYRGKGIGSRLMNAYFKYLKENGVNGVYCQTFDYEGSKSVEFFKKHGMKMYDRKETKIYKDYFKKKMWVVTMVRGI